MNEEQQKAVQVIIRDLLDDKKAVTKPLIKQFAKMLSETYADTIHNEVLAKLSTASSNSLNDIFSKIREMAGFATIDYNKIVDVLLQRPDVLKLDHWHMREFLHKADDDRFIKYWTMAAANKQLSKTIERMDDSSLKRITEFKELKNMPELIKVAEAYIKVHMPNVKNTNNYQSWALVTSLQIERLLPAMGKIANFSTDIQTAFEEHYLNYLENRSAKHSWEQKTYVSILCRSLRAYKNKEFRNTLIKKLVLIKIPTLQKRMAREFARSRRYLNLA